MKGLLFCAWVLLLAACTPEPKATFAANPIRSQPCEGRDHAYIQSRCGRFYPNPAQPSIYIAFAVLTPQRADVKLANATLEPVVYFSGGPGEGGNTLADKLDHWRYWMLDANIQRPLILWDSRGNEGAWGYFQCDAYRLWAINQLRYPDLKPGAELSQVQACLVQWRSKLGGAGFEQFSARQSAQDIVALLMRLGYQSWHFVSTSYGSRVAQYAHTLAPDQVKSFILDSPYSWAMTSRLDHARRWQEAFEDMLVWCQAHEYCHQGESVQSLFWQAIASLDRSSLNIRFRLEQYYYQANIDANTFAHILFSTLYGVHSLQAASTGPIEDKRLSRLVPLLRQVAHGDATLLETIAAPVLSASYSSAANPWLYWITECNDNQVLSVEQYRTGIAGQGRWARFFAPDMSLLVCHQVTVHQNSLAPTFRPASLLSPAVVLHGEHDPVVSLKDALELKRSFTVALTVEAAEQGHGVLANDGCGTHWLAQYWQDPASFVRERQDKLARAAPPRGGRIPFIDAGNGSASPCEILL